MKKIVAILLILVMSLGLFSCFASGDVTDNITGTDETSSTTLPTSGTTGTGGTSASTTRPFGTTGTTSSGTTSSVNVTIPEVPKEDPDLSGINPDELALYYEFFNPENHIALNLDISQKELQKIQKDYENYSAKGSKSPIYRMADLYVTITKPTGEKLEYCIEQVGVRMKGNTSRTNFWDSSAGMYNLVHFKISFQETFDDAVYYGSDALTWADADARKARKDRTFATLEKIDMRWNKNDDPTYIREYYAYEIYREFGVLAPRTNLASVDIANDHAGVWLFYEPIDKIFLEKNLSPEALGGDLYKLGWTSEGATFTSFKSYGVKTRMRVNFTFMTLRLIKRQVITLHSEIL